MHTFCWVSLQFESQSLDSTQVFRRNSSTPNFSWILWTLLRSMGGNLKYKTLNVHVYPVPDSLPFSLFLSTLLQNKKQIFPTEFCETVLISRFFQISQSLCFNKLWKVCLPNTFSSLPGKMMINDTFLITLYSDSTSPTGIKNFLVRSSRFQRLFKSPPGGKKKNSRQQLKILKLIAIKAKLQKMKSSLTHINLGGKVACLLHCTLRYIATECSSRQELCFKEAL